MEFFLPQRWSNPGTGTQIRLDLTELPALYGPILRGEVKPNHPKLFYHPVILRVTYTEAIASIFFVFFFLTAMYHKVQFLGLQFKI